MTADANVKEAARTQAAEAARQTSSSSIYFPPITYNTYSKPQTAQQQKAAGKADGHTYRRADKQAIKRHSCGGER